MNSLKILRSEDRRWCLHTHVMLITYKFIRNTYYLNAISNILIPSVTVI